MSNKDGKCDTLESFRYKKDCNVMACWNESNEAFRNKESQEDLQNEAGLNILDLDDEIKAINMRSTIAFLCNKTRKCALQKIKAKFEEVVKANKGNEDKNES